MWDMCASEDLDYTQQAILFLHFTLVVSENAAEKMTEFEILG